VSGMNLVPHPSLTPPPSGRQLALQGMSAALALLIGVLWASRLDVAAGGERLSGTLAALLIILGLCGTIVTLIQYLGGRR